MDLMFDSQVLRHRGPDDLPEPVLASIAGYYHRATTTSRPMSYLIALVMVILLGALGFRAVAGDDPGWLLLVSAVLVGVPILLALIHTLPSAVRLGNRVGGRPSSRVSRDRSAGITCCVWRACRDFWCCGWRWRAVRPSRRDLSDPRRMVTTCDSV
jgi:hypothetical protein